MTSTKAIVYLGNLISSLVAKPDEDSPWKANIEKLTMKCQGLENRSMLVQKFSHQVKNLRRLSLLICHIDWGKAKMLGWSKNSQFYFCIMLGISSKCLIFNQFYFYGVGWGCYHLQVLGNFQKLNRTTNIEKWINEGNSSLQFL